MEVYYFMQQHINLFYCEFKLQLLNLAKNPLKNESHLFEDWQILPALPGPIRKSHKTRKYYKNCKKNREKIKNNRTNSE